MRLLRSRPGTCCAWPLVGPSPNTVDLGPPWEPDLVPGTLEEDPVMVRTAARLPNGTRISDHVALGVLTTTIPADLVDAVLAETGRQSQRQRQLPARLVVYHVLALALYAQASYGEVLRCLLEGVRWLRLNGIGPALADKSAITKARTRLGPAPM